MTHRTYRNVITAGAVAFLLLATFACDNPFSDSPTEPDLPVAARVDCNASGFAIFCSDRSTGPDLELFRVRAVLGGVIVATAEGSPGTQVSMDVSDDGAGTYTVRHELEDKDGNLIKGDDIPVVVTGG